MKVTQLVTKEPVAIPGQIGSPTRMIRGDAADMTYEPGSQVVSIRTGIGTGFVPLANVLFAMTEPAVKK